jgi:SAM-dependent methyltransferase
VNPAPNFDRLARLYRWMEFFSFGPFLTRCRLAFLSELSLSRRALVLGDGDGRFTARLLRANLDIRVDAIDASPAMLRALLRAAGAHASRVETQVADIRDFVPQRDGYDLVATHFFLDCLTTAEIKALADRLRPVLTPTGLWLVSEFAVPSTLFGSIVARPLVAALYRAFGLLTGLTIRRLPDHRAALRSAGFRLVQTRALLLGLLSSELWSPGAEVSRN